MSKHTREIIGALTQACINVRAAEAFLRDELIDLECSGKGNKRGNVKSAAACRDMRDILSELTGLRNRAVKRAAARAAKEKTDGG